METRNRLILVSLLFICLCTYVYNLLVVPVAVLAALVSWVGEILSGCDLVMNCPPGINVRLIKASLDLVQRICELGDFVVNHILVSLFVTYLSYVYLLLLDCALMLCVGKQHFRSTGKIVSGSTHGSFLTIIGCYM